jgi:hypothetical protein
MTDKASFLRPRQQGSSGTTLIGGRIRNEEPNSNLVGKEWAEEAMDMLRTDDSVQAAWEAISSTLLSAKWIAEPGDSSSPFSVQLADDANKLFGFNGYTSRMDRSWEEIVSELLLHEYIGFRYAEPIWQYRPEIGYVDLIDIADRDPRVHDRWIINGPRLEAVSQMPPMVDAQSKLFSPHLITQSMCGGPTMLATDILLLTRGRTGQNYEGRGLARGAYFLRKLKNHVLDMISIASERWAFSTPLIKGDREAARAAGIADTEYDAQLEAARTSLANYMAEEASYLESTPFISFEAWGGNLDASSMLEIVNYCDIGILRCFLVQFLALGVNDTGSRAVGSVQESFFRRACINVLDRIAAGMNGVSRPGGGVIGRWVELNHGRVDASLLPKLVHSGLELDTLMEFSSQIPGLTSAGWLIPDLDARNTLRRRLALPPENPPEEGAP